MRHQREYHLSCTHPGCLERSRHLTTYESDWKCPRHQKPHERLSTTNLSTTAEWELREWWSQVGFDQVRMGSRWHRDGDVKSSFEAPHSPGFHAEGDDFPPGTRLIVTTHVILPEAAPTLAEALATMTREWSEKELRVHYSSREMWQDVFDGATRMVSEETPDPDELRVVVGKLRAYAKDKLAAPDRRLSAPLIADALEARF